MEEIFNNFKDTSEIRFSDNPLERVIGQDKEFIKMAIKRRRHLLMVGFPGTGKSMVAKAMSELIDEPNEEVILKNNPEMPSSPTVIVNRYPTDVLNFINNKTEIPYKVLDPSLVHSKVSLELNFQCQFCSLISNSDLIYCPYCGKIKHKDNLNQKEDDMRVRGVIRFRASEAPKNNSPNFLEIESDNTGSPKGIYERAKDHIHYYEPRFTKLRLKKVQKDTAVLLKLGRKKLVSFGGSEEEELLGMVKHDPFGNDPNVGTPEYKLVVPGAVHKAHQGVLFIDEIEQIRGLQSKLLTAIQDKKFPISRGGRGTSGAAVVEDVPCDFILVAAANFANLDKVSAPLRSRFRGMGYELLMRDAMPRNEANVMEYLKFISFEADKEGCVITNEVCRSIVNLGASIAFAGGRRNSLTLRLRGIAGVIKSCADAAYQRGSTVVDMDDYRRGLQISQALEVQAAKVYGSIEDAVEAENATSSTF